MTATSPPRRRRWPGAIAAGTAAVVLAAGCGVRSTRGASAVGDDDVPYDLLSPTVATTTTAPPPRQTRPTEVFFVRNGMLVPVVRDLAYPVTVSDTLDALAAGPSEAETAGGLRTALPDGKAIASAAVGGGSARLTLTEDFARATPQEQVLAIAQLVFTVTSVAGIGNVAFFLGDVAIDVPRPDGSVAAGPVSRDDYQSLLTG